MPLNQPTATKNHCRCRQNEDFDTIEICGSLAEWGRKMPEYFPAGGDSAPSEAAPAKRSDFSGFSRAAENYTLSAEQLIVPV